MDTRRPIPSGRLNARDTLELNPTHSAARAWLNGALGIVIRPEKGWLRSSIRRIAEDAESALTSNAATMVRFGRANSPKLTKIIVIQNISTAMNGFGTGLSDCPKRIRVCARSVVI